MTCRCLADGIHTLTPDGKLITECPQCGGKASRLITMREGLKFAKQVLDEAQNLRKGDFESVAKIEFSATLVQSVLENLEDGKSLDDNLMCYYR